MAKKKPEPKPKRHEIETFRDIGQWEMRQISQSEPSCSNGIVRVHKWRVVAELIEEPVEVIAERLLKLWRESDNIHDMGPLKVAAAEIGFQLPHGEWGRDRKRR